MTPIGEERHTGGEAARSQPVVGGDPSPATRQAEPSAPLLTDAQRELLEDKYVLWVRASREGAMDLRDYNRRAAEALKAALCICSDYRAAIATAHAEANR